MPKTKKSTVKKTTSKKASPVKKMVKTSSPHMTKTVFGASYLLILAILSLLLITISNQLFG